ncbi:MAG: hypothetical protein IPO04_22350 [Cytophagaceae bacterium]|nr:hypothetical protein [Cytophagaceae bacterium]
MSIAEIKIDLINQITNITDKVKLNEIKQLINFQSDNIAYITNVEEKIAISEAQKQIQDGLVFTHDEVQKDFEKWLGK